MIGPGNSAWIEKPLAEVCDIRIGRTPSRANSDYWGDGQPWATISDLSRGKFVSKTKEMITAKAIQECNCKPVPKGTLLLSFKLSVGHLGFSAVPIFTNEAIAALTVRDETLLDKNYLYHFLRVANLKEGADRAAKGATLNKAKLELIPVRFPRLLSEQQRIAAILDKADDLIEKRVKALAKISALTKSVFLDRFGDPKTNPKGWEQKEIATIGSVITGNTPPRENLDYYGNSIEWIKSDNLNTPHHYLTRASEGLSDAGKAVGRTAPANSVLVTCIAGSRDCIGNAAIADREVAFNQQINAVVPNEPSDHIFIYAQLLVAKRLVQETSTEGMKGLVSKSRFERIRLIWPPSDARQNFGRVFLTLNAIREKQIKSASKLDGFLATLKHRAFRGEL